MRKAYLLLAHCFCGSALQCQQLTVQTDPGKQVVLGRSDLEALPHVKANAADHASAPANFEGVTLKSVLSRRQLWRIDEGQAPGGLPAGRGGRRLFAWLLRFPRPTRHLPTSRFCSPSCAMGNRWARKKVRTELLSQMKNEWPDGSDG